MTSNIINDDYNYYNHDYDETINDDNYQYLIESMEIKIDNTIYTYSNNIKEEVSTLHEFLIEKGNNNDIISTFTNTSKISISQHIINNSTNHTLNNICKEFINISHKLWNNHFINTNLTISTIIQCVNIELSLSVYYNFLFVFIIFFYIFVYK